MRTGALILLIAIIVWAAAEYWFDCGRPKDRQNVHTGWDT